MIQTQQPIIQLKQAMIQFRHPMIQLQKLNRASVMAASAGIHMLRPFQSATTGLPLVRE